MQIPGCCCLVLNGPHKVHVLNESLVSRVELLADSGSLKMWGLVRSWVTEGGPLKEAVELSSRALSLPLSLSSPPSFSYHLLSLPGHERNTFLLRHPPRCAVAFTLARNSEAWLPVEHKPPNSLQHSLFSD